MKPLRVLFCLSFVAMGVVGCAATSDAQTSRSSQVVEATGKVVDGLAAETAQRLTVDPYRGLAVVVRTGSGQGAEPMLAELLRTRLLERGIAVEVACPARCVEISMIEFAVDTAASGALTPGQVLTVAAGTVPGVSGLSRPAGERVARPTGVLVTFAARDGNRFLARSHAVAILSSESR
jgi:hypothetical protein